MYIHSLLDCNILLFFLAAPCSMQDLSSSDRDWIGPPAVEVWSPNHWTAMEFPKISLNILTLLYLIHLNNLYFYPPSSLSQLIAVIMKYFLTVYLKMTTLKIISQEKKKTRKVLPVLKQRTTNVFFFFFLTHKTVEKFLQVLRLSTCVSEEGPCGIRSKYQMNSSGLWAIPCFYHNGLLNLPKQARSGYGTLQLPS